MVQLHLPHTPLVEMWDVFTRTHMSTLKLCFLWAFPLSIVPPAMLYYAAVTYGSQLLQLTEMQLITIVALFLIVEMAMTFIVATLIQYTGEVIDIRPDFEDAYKLAVVVPTPLWLAPLFLFIPSFILNITVGALALILSGMLIFYNVPAILKVEEKGHAMLLSGSILAVGMVAWAVLMYVTLLSWGWITSTLPLMR